VVSAWITAQDPVNLARIDIDVFAAFTDCFVQYPMKLIAKIVGA
jgi:hypothetical protein